MERSCSNSPNISHLLRDNIHGFSAFSNIIICFLNSSKVPQQSKRKLQSNKGLSARWEETNLNERQDSTNEDEDYGNSMELNNWNPEDDCKEL